MQQQDQQQDQQRPLTMEELVRQIAGELDVQATSNTLGYVNDLLADFQPKGGGDGGLIPIITRVEVKRAEQLEQHDGLFHHQFPDLLAMAAIGQHTYLPGPPGSGKSHAGEQVADALGWKYVDISLSQDMPESRIWGGRTADGGFVETPVLDAIRWACENPDSGAIVLFDEMDAARPGLLTSINSTLANRKVTAPNGDMLRFGDNLTFLGAANTYGTGPTAEFPGRFKIDPATIDRFTYLPWDTDVAMETAVVHSFLHDGDMARAWLDVWHTLRSNVSTYGLKFFVTMRGARNGARMIASGFPMDKTLMLVAGNKIPADQWAKVNPL
jgi:cobaltochelatase CobS